MLDVERIDVPANVELAKLPALPTLLALLRDTKHMIADLPTLIVELLAFAPPPAGTDPAQAKSQMFTQIGTMVVLMVVIWVLLIRPQQKRAREQALLTKSIKPGDKVGTTSGIVGVVVSVKDHTLMIRTADSKIEVTKNSVQERLQEGAAEPESPAKISAKN